MNEESLARVALSVAFVALACGYLLNVPLFEAPDEQSHIHYVGFMATERRPPRHLSEPEVPGEGMQPPLYYALAAPLYLLVAPDEPTLLSELGRAGDAVYRKQRGAMRPNRLLRPAPKFSASSVRRFKASDALSPLKSLRLLSLLLGLCALLLTMGAVRRLGGDASLSFLAGAILGLNPQFLFVTSSVGNESAGAVIGAAALWLVASPLAGAAVARRDYMLLAALSVIGLLTKNSTLPVLGVSALAIYFVDRRALAFRARDVGLASASGLILAAPLLLWNTLNRGDALGLTAVLASASDLAGPERVGGVVAYLTGIYPEWLLESYWALFGWMNLSAPGPVHWFFAGLMLVGATGFVLAWRSNQSDEERDEETDGEIARKSARVPKLSSASHVYLLAAPALNLALHIALNTQTIQAQGRHLFPAAAHIACVLAIGIAWLAEWVGERQRVAFGAAIVLALIALYCLVFVIVPAYAQAPTHAFRGAPLPRGFDGFPALSDPESSLVWPIRCDSGHRGFWLRSLATSDKPISVR